jgi:hypothetical protein
LEELFTHFRDFTVDINGAEQRQAFLFRGFSSLPVSLHSG